DIILLGGDYVHRDPKYIEPCFSVLGKLKAAQGVYAVLGNHDHWEGADLTRKSMSRVGITLIDNKALWLKNGEARIKLGGVGDYIEDIPDVEPTISDTQKEDFVILLTHNPDFVEHIDQIAADKIDTVFAGHTHGGQVTLFGMYAPIIPSENGQKYRTGSLEINSMKVIISNGLGTVTPPVRFFARPQIIVATLESGE
ncbi:MAG: metallophosphoesterase, partial [Halanaerobiales bacterium]